jgi:hypothetical protein
MAIQSKKGRVGKRSRIPQLKILESITGTEALAILRVLVGRNESVAQEIDAIAESFSVMWR